MNDSLEIPADGVRRQDMSETELELVDEELRRLKNLVRVRQLLEDRGASVTVIREHAAEIERLRERPAQHVRAAAA